jgi:LDH2 family malate/lactate/ureidoglycolate dehydrogenase
VTNSPVSVAFPTKEQPPVVLDMGCSFLAFDRSACAENPFPFFKAMGLSNIVQLLGGVFSGIYKPEFQTTDSSWESNQGSFILVVDVNHFMPLDELCQAVDQYVEEVRAMHPLPGSDGSELAGGVEWRWEQENRRKGIPVSPEHRLALVRIATELEVASPF